MLSWTLLWGRLGTRPSLNQLAFSKSGRCSIMWVGLVQSGEDLRRAKTSLPQWRRNAVSGRPPRFHCNSGSARVSSLLAPPGSLARLRNCMSHFLKINYRPAFHLSTYLPIHLFIYLPIHLPTCLSTYHPPTHLPTHPATQLPTHPPTHLSTHLPIYPPTHLFIRPSLHLAVHLSADPAARVSLESCDSHIWWVSVYYSFLTKCLQWLHHLHLLWRILWSNCPTPEILLESF